MKTNHSDDARTSVPVDFGGENAFGRLPQSIIPKGKFFPDLGLKRSGSLGRYLPYQRIPFSTNRVKLSAPYKSELCLKFINGRCSYGENCCFSHNLSEIRKPELKTAATLEHVSERNAMVRECRYTSNGQNCPFGDKCHFLHKCHQISRRAAAGLRGVRDRNGSNGIDCMRFRGGKHYDKSIFYKTQLCTRWEDIGSCPYGEKCTYAHGREELQKTVHLADSGDFRASKFTLHVQASYAGSCKRNEVHFMEWDTAKTSEIYADWIGGHGF